MNKNSLVRKIAYIASIVILLGPLFALGRPGQGLIGQLRTKHKMGQANLGKLDPTSESMRLATLGLKGIASTVLWLRADYYKEEKYFDRFSATLNQIGLLQPHFISVWQHQAHNLGYNLSPEFEDYRQRYEWVKKGIDYLVRGSKFNDRKPILQYDLGQQYFGTKLGKADEKKQYRSLYRADTEFHRYLKDEGLAGIETTALGYDQRPDNWLTGKLWLNKATDLFEAGAPIKKSPHLLYSYSPNWQMYYGEGIEAEGILDSSAKFAWKQGGYEWQQFGTKSLFQYRQGVELTLLSHINASKEVDAMENRFADLTNKVKDLAIEKLRETIPADKLKIYDEYSGDRSESDRAIYYEVFQKLNPTFQQIAAQLKGKEQVEALELATKLTDSKQFLKNIVSYREQVNYAYWEERARAEQTDEMVDARRMMFEADKQIDVANVKGALELYEQAWNLWGIVFKRYPTMMTEEVGDDVLKSINRYKRLLDADLDEKFVLYDFMNLRRAFNADSLDARVEEKIRDLKAEAEKMRGVDGLPVDPPPAVEPSPTPEIPAPAEVKPEEAKVEPESSEPTLPPTLENPDFQN